jgi:hypothetical protein
MRGFILGVIVTLVVLGAVALLVAEFGFMPTNADATPPEFETRIASSALDAAMERHAPRVNNPVPATDDNLIGGMKIYSMNCAVCHGTSPACSNTRCIRLRRNCCLIPWMIPNGTSTTRSARAFGIQECHPGAAP